MPRRWLFLPIDPGKVKLAAFVMMSVTPPAFGASAANAFIAAERGDASGLGALPPELRQPRPSGVETLLVSGSIDLSTPAPYATDELLPSLANGEQVILSEFGHLDFYTPPEAFERLALSFLNRGEADISLYEAKTFTFDPALNFPMIGKLIAAAIVGIPLLLVAIVLFVVWRVRRRRRSAQAGPAIS